MASILLREKMDSRSKEQKQGTCLFSSTVLHLALCSWDTPLPCPQVHSRRVRHRKMLWRPQRQTPAPGKPHLLSLFRDEYLLGWVFTADS